LTKGKQRSGVNDPIGSKNPHVAETKGAEKVLGGVKSKASDDGQRS